MKPQIDCSFEITEGLDDYCFGQEVQSEALDSIEWYQLFQWWDCFYWDIHAEIGQMINGLGFEQCWAAMYYPQKFTVLHRWWPEAANA